VPIVLLLPHSEPVRIRLASLSPRAEPGKISMRWCHLFWTPRSLREYRRGYGPSLGSSGTMRRERMLTRGSRARAAVLQAGATSACGGRRCHHLGNRSGIWRDRCRLMASRGRLGWRRGRSFPRRGPHSEGRVLFSRARLPHSRAGVLVAPACAASGLARNSLLEPKEM
jgi:hypothetical protein